MNTPINHLLVLNKLNIRLVLGWSVFLGYLRGATHNRKANPVPRCTFVVLHVNRSADTPNRYARRHIAPQIIARNCLSSIGRLKVGIVTVCCHLAFSHLFSHSFPHLNEKFQSPDRSVDWRSIGNLGRQRNVWHT